MPAARFGPGRGDAGKRKLPLTGFRLRLEQASYRIGHGCIEEIFKVRRVFEICDQYPKYLVVPVFIDFGKVFDSNDRYYTARALTAIDIHPYLIRGTLSLGDPTGRVMSIDGLSDPFGLDHGFGAGTLSVYQRVG